MLLTMSFFPAMAGAQEAGAPATAPPERRVAIDPVAALTNGPWGLIVSSYGGWDRVSTSGPTISQSEPAGSGGETGVSGRFSAKRDRRRTRLGLTGESR